MKSRLSLVWLVAVEAVAWGVPFTVTVTPSADAFVRSLDPTHNYGAAGGLSVSGAAAVNGQGQQMGLLDSFIRFNVAGLVAQMDAHFGGHNWSVQSATLHVTEQAAPNNPIFNRGLGQFDARWIASDGWLEGTGDPSAPTTNGVIYQDEPSLLNPLTDVSLGTFANSGLNGELAFLLDLPQEFTADIAAGGDVSLFFTAADDAIGFTINSRDISGGGRLPPRLEITADLAVPEPATAALVVAGLLALRRRRRTVRG